MLPVLLAHISGIIILLWRNSDVSLVWVLIVSDASLLTSPHQYVSHFPLDVSMISGVSHFA